MATVNDTDYGDNDEAASNLIFSTTNGGTESDKMIITGRGDIGIGTTSPSDILHVHKASANTRLIVGNNAAYDQFIYFQGNNDWSMGIDYSNSNAFTLSNYSSIGTNNRITVTTGGNVGIGTTSPNDKLHIVGNLFIEDSSPEITLETGTSHYNWQIAAQENVDTALEFSVGSQDSDASNDTFTPKMVILQNGNVGIGNTNPGYLLTVSGEIATDSYIRHNGDSDTYFGFSGANTYKVHAGG